jgi:hypothetical protein
MATESIPQAPISSDQYVDSRDYRIHALSLIGADGVPRDITEMVVEIQIRQDIYLGFMSGDLLITDGTDIHSISALHGNEYLHVHITEPEHEDVPIKKTFRVYKVGGRETTQNNSQRYTIYFCSDELFQSHTKKVSKGYKGEKVSDIAKDIMSSYLKVPDNQIIIDPTSDPMSIVIPNKRPSEALQWLTTRAFSQPDDTCYFFYENLNGFNFRSLQSIYRTGTIIKVPFRYESKSIAKELGMDKYAIDSIDVKHDFDALKSVSQGGYAMKLQGLDPFHQTITNTDYSVDKVKTLYPNPAMTNPVSDDTALFDKSESHYMTYIQTEGTSTEEKNHAESWVKRNMSLTALKSLAIQIVIPGSARVQIGTLLNIKVPYASTPTDSSDIWDKRKSGRYLVVAVNQKFDMVNHRWDTIALLARDSVPESLPPLDTTLPDKIKKLNKQ